MRHITSSTKSDVKSFDYTVILLNQNIIISAFCIRTAKAFNGNVYTKKIILTKPGLSPPGNLVMNCNNSEKPDSFTHSFSHSQLMPPAIRPKSLQWEINIFVLMLLHFKTMQIKRQCDRDA